MTPISEFTQPYSALTFLHATSNLSPREQHLLIELQQFLKGLKPDIYAHFNAGTSPQNFMSFLGEKKILGCSLPISSDPVASDLLYGLALYCIEHLDSGLRSLVSVHSSLAMYAIHRYATSESKKYLLPDLQTQKKTACFALTEPLHGSDPASMETTLTYKNGVAYLNGVKHWVTNANQADVMVVWFKNKDQYLGAYIDPKSTGVKIEPMPTMMSLRTSPSFHITFKDVEIPASQIFEVEGLKGPLSCLNNARWGVAWGALGAASACFEEALHFTQNRTQFGRPLAKNQLVQAQLAKMWTEIQLGISYMIHLTKMKADKTLTPQHVSLAKAHHVRQALEISRSARDLLGGVGVTQKFHTFRHMVNLESVNTYEGTENIHKLILGQYLTGQSAFA